MRLHEQVRLSTGLEVDYVLPWARDLLLASGAAAEAVRRATSAMGDVAAEAAALMELEALASSAAYQDEAVRSMIRALNGVPVRFDAAEDLRGYLSEQEFRELALIGTQRVDAPTVAPAPEDTENVARAAAAANTAAFRAQVERER